MSRKSFATHGLEVVVDRWTGAIESLSVGEWSVAGHGPAAAVGSGWELFVPVPGKRSVWVRSSDNSGPAVTECGDRLELEWTDPTDTLGAMVALTVKAIIAPGEHGLEFTMRLENRSDRTVEAVAWPMLERITPAGGDHKLVRRHYDGSGLNDRELYPVFRESAGYWGTHNPTDGMGSNAPWGLFQLLESDGRGLYIGRHDSENSRLATWIYELEGGYDDSLTATAQAGRVAFRAQQFVFLGPGESVELAPWVLAGYEGSWPEGASIYRAWRSTWLNQPALPQWARDPHSWLQIQIFASEDVVNFRYTDLPDIARECRDAGIRAIQLTGWAYGGQDRGNPRHDTDPALGTREELKAAIAECRAMGVEIVLFCKWTWVDQSQPHYNEMTKYLARNAYGYPYPGGGWAYYTPSQLAGLTTCPLVPTCTAMPAWQGRAVEEFRRVADLEPSGILYDESQHHGSATYCFASDHGHQQPAFLYHHDVALVRAFKDALRERGQSDSTFLFAGEHVNDFEMTEYQMLYTRFGNGHIPVGRFVAPNAPLQMAVRGTNDRGFLNRCLQYRYIASYEPRNFKGRPSEAPLTVEYGRKIDGLRTRYREFLWDGRFEGPRGAEVTVDGEPCDDYSCFVADDERRAVVVANTGAATTEVAMAEMQTATYCTPEDPDLRPWTGSIRLEPGHVVVIIAT